MMGLSGGGLYPNLSYHASKGGVVNLTRALAVEWARAACASTRCADRGCAPS
jgi:NAD(P)-dependent dehydrogenase (short-subunit alcohol dehydrogenase family)